MKTIHNNNTHYRLQLTDNKNHKLYKIIIVINNFPQLEFKNLKPFLPLGIDNNYQVFNFS